MLVREISTSSPTSDFVVKRQLLKLRMKAIRAGVWFRALQRIDRALIDLTIKVIAENVRSFTLAKSILSVERKLEGLLENKIVRAIREIGFPLAHKLSQFAQNWGNMSARNWTSDLSFARFLAAMNLNEPTFAKP
jgi:hypothetical protein